VRRETVIEDAVIGDPESLGPLLTLYMDIKDPRIQAISGQQPQKPREIKLWTFTFDLPGLLSPLIRAWRGK
jgi:hypothetical protein